MIRIFYLASMALSIIFTANYALSNEHDHKSEAKHEEHEEGNHGHDEHTEENHQEKGSKHDDHAHEGEHEDNKESAQIGPNKGILEASDKNGIKLSPEAEKNFEIARVKVSALGSAEIPKKALVTAVDEVNVYRYRAGFYKRIDFDKVSHTQQFINIKSKDLKSGDEIAVSGLGFLRIAEIAAFGGAPEGHSH